MLARFHSLFLSLSLWVTMFPAPMNASFFWQTVEAARSRPIQKDRRCTVSSCWEKRERSERTSNSKRFEKLDASLVGSGARLRRPLAPPHNRSGARCREVRRDVDRSTDWPHHRRRIPKGNSWDRLLRTRVMFLYPYSARFARESKSSRRIERNSRIWISGRRLRVVRLGSFETLKFAKVHYPQKRFFGETSLQYYKQRLKHLNVHFIGW